MRHTGQTVLNPFVVVLYLQEDELYFSDLTVTITVHQTKHSLLFNERIAELGMRITQKDEGLHLM